jgi:hypothetical protein
MSLIARKKCSEQLRPDVLDSLLPLRIRHSREGANPRDRAKRTATASFRILRKLMQRRKAKSIGRAQEHSPSC